jgi:Meiotically up-regulated gene 113
VTAADLKTRIIAEIQRTAAENGGAALGQERFESLTGITTGQWRGKYWRTWGEAVKDAGFTPLQLNQAHPEEFLAECLAQLARKNQRFPTYADVRMERQQNPSFPAHQAFSRLGSREQRIQLLARFIADHPAYEDVRAFLPTEADALDADEPEDEPQTGDGFVYMVKLGRHYKVGKTFAVPRRHREIALELPEKPDLVHTIRTDDPSGIEAYWHARFAPRRANGEWFELTRDDIRAFKRRKFM